MLTCRANLKMYASFLTFYDVLDIKHSLMIPGTGLKYCDNIYTILCTSVWVVRWLGYLTTCSDATIPDCSKYLSLLVCYSNNHSYNLL